MEINQILQACDWAGSSFLIFSQNVFSPLIYYSHLLPLVVSLIIAGVLYFGNRKYLPNKVFFVMVALFSVWIFGDLVLWATPSPEQTTFFWSVVNIIEPLVYVAAIYFIYAFTRERLPSQWAQGLLFVLMLPIFILTPTHYGILGFNLTNCDREAVEGIMVYYGYAIEVLMALWILGYGFWERHRAKDIIEKRKILLFTVGLALFLLSFALGNVLGSLLSDWTIGQIGLFGLPVFALFLSVLLVRYQAFHTKSFSAQILVLMLWALIGSIFFVQNLGLIHSITGITLGVMIIFGVLLIRSVQHEIEQRETLTVLKDKLEAANVQLKVLDASKNEFLSFATHQLRSPLTSIKWGLGAVGDTLIDRHADAETRTMVDHLAVTTDDLISTVNDLLDISKIEQGGLVLKNEEFDLYDMTARIVEEFKITAQKKGLKLVMTGDVVPQIMVGDATKLRQVFVNLIDNAIKYTKEGTVTVSFTQEAHRARMAVADTGPGIAPEELDQLFDKFIRGAAGKASQAGSGLGLYLARKIVEMHKGHMSVASEGLGKGSAFTVVLPVA